MVAVGLEAAPELKRIDASLAAQERLLASTQRAFYSPSLVFREVKNVPPPMIAGCRVFLSATSQSGWGSVLWQG